MIIMIKCLECGHANVLSGRASWDRSYVVKFIESRVCRRCHVRLVVKRVEEVVGGE